ncbi:MAG: HAD family hydrolase [Candidatus Omnitrophica bacterium]|nr:HAD family hydrolase [Candidatus Omnitrophota bacterium]
MKNIKLIIFDLDGTLVDAYPAIISSFNYTMHRLGYPKQSKLSIRRAVGWGDENLLKVFIRQKDLSAALSIYRQHHEASLIRQSRLFPYVSKVLTYLKDKGYKLAVASNRPSRFSQILIRHLKIKRYFSYVLCADKLRRGKPHPEIINKIVKKLVLKPQEVFYVGDMVIDALAGKAAGVRTIIVTTGSSSKEEVKKTKPYRIIRRISGLLHIL